MRTIKDKLLDELVARYDKPPTTIYLGYVEYMELCCKAKEDIDYRLGELYFHGIPVYKVSRLNHFAVC